MFNRDPELASGGAGRRSWPVGGEVAAQFGRASVRVGESTLAFFGHFLYTPRTESLKYNNCMGVPKKRHSAKRRGDRRAKTGVTALAMFNCAKCGAPTLPHRMCGKCWTYRGVSVASASAEQTETAEVSKSVKA